jgi:hypothetical protein
VCGLEVFVQEYEIRVLSAGGTIAVMEEIHLSDHAAIRSAKKFADDRSFEVWRGLDCIYETTSKSAPRLAPRIRGESA